MIILGQRGDRCARPWQRHYTGSLPRALRMQAIGQVKVAGWNAFAMSCTQQPHGLAALDLGFLPAADSGIGGGSACDLAIPT